MNVLINNYQIKNQNKNLRILIFIIEKKIVKILIE